MSGFKSNYKLNTKYHQMWRAKDIMKDLYLGVQQKPYHMIPTLMSKFQKEDAGSVVNWSTNPNCTIFQHAFICPSTTRSAMNYCQPQVSLDTCHTKNMKFYSQLLMATTLNGNSEVVIFNFALAPVENIENWTWFCTLLRVFIIYLI